ncbi:hypothetical protein ACOSP7_030957 [Xanthoceras sorbifolium]
MFRFIWCLKIPPKIKFFLWTLCHDKILINVHRATRGLIVDISCPRCQYDIKDLDHLFRGCNFYVKIWEDVCKGCTSSVSFRGNYMDWLLSNLKDKNSSSCGLPNFFLLLSRCGLYGSSVVVVCLMTTLRSPFFLIWVNFNFGGDWWDVCKGEGISE